MDTYPKRTDLWSVYLELCQQHLLLRCQGFEGFGMQAGNRREDAHIKAFTPPKAPEADHDEIRALFRRCCSMSLLSRIGHTARFGMPCQTPHRLESRGSKLRRCDSSSSDGWASNLDGAMLRAQHLVTLQSTVQLLRLLPYSCC